MPARSRRESASPTTATAQPAFPDLRRRALQGSTRSRSRPRAAATPSPRPLFLTSPGLRRSRAGLRRPSPQARRGPSPSPRAATRPRASPRPGRFHRESPSPTTTTARRALRARRPVPREAATRSRSPPPTASRPTPRRTSSSRSGRRPMCPPMWRPWQSSRMGLSRLPAPGRAPVGIPSPATPSERLQWLRSRPHRGSTRLLSSRSARPMLSTSGPSAGPGSSSGLPTATTARG